MMDLFARLEPPCGDCRHLGAALDSGIRYCHGAMMWRWASDRVDGCGYREPIRHDARDGASPPINEAP